MSGFGRTGHWFAVDHWASSPIALSMAKGLTSAYVPLGAVGMRRTLPSTFAKVFPAGSPTTAIRSPARRRSRRWTSTSRTA